MVKMLCKNIATMFILLLLVIFTMCPLGTLDTVDVTNLVNVTGYVGETIELRCFDPSTTDKFDQEMGDVKWMYLLKVFQVDCSHNTSYAYVAKCENGDWQYISYGHHLVGDDDACDNGLAYIRSKESGNFTYKCELKSGHTTTFIININAREHLPMSSCIAKLVPPTKSLMFEFICTNYHRDCFSEEGNDNDFFIQHNGTRIVPDITLGNKVIVRRETHNISSISQYYCITNNNSSPCVVDNVTLTDPVRITPLVNKVTAGSDVTFVCALKYGHESSVKYSWRLSRHIQLSRISGTASSTLKICNVQYADDSVMVRCELDVNGTTFYSEAYLKILSENRASTLSTEFTTFNSDPMTTGSDSNPEFELYEALITACSLLVICALFIIVIIVVNSIMQRLRKRSTNISPNVQTAIGLTPPDESNAMSLRYSTGRSPIPRKPSVVSLPLPLTPSPTSNSVISPVEIHVGLDESPQQQVALTEDGLLLSGLCQSPPLSPLLTSTPYSSQIEHVTERETLPQCVTKPAASLSSKEAPRHTSIGSPLTSRTRKTPVTDQPLPVIPKSPLRNDEEQGKGNDNTSPTSKELPVAVIKPTINEYSSIGDNQQGYGDSRENAIRFNSLSAVLETHNDRHGNTRFDYTQEHLQKLFPDSEAKSPDRDNNHSIKNSHVYAIPDEDTKGNIAGTSAKSIYHTIDQDSNTLFSSKGQYDGPTPAMGDNICSNHHIYELPEDEVATEENKHSTSVETPFYFTLESGKNNESEDVATGQSTLHLPTTHIPEKNPNIPISMISESDHYVQIAKGRKKKQTSNVASNRVGDGKGKNP